MSQNKANFPDIPHRTEGDSHDTVSMYCADTIEMAMDYYKKLEARFKSVNEWHALSDKVKAEFKLLDGRMARPTESLEKGNFIRIDVPGIGNPSGGGYDWTKVVDIQNNSEEYYSPFFSMTLRPCAATDDTDETVAHFYSQASTNTFVVRRVGTCIYAEVHGRNEIENTSEVPVLDSVRNKAVAMGGKLGLGKMNWQGFTKALLEPFGKKNES